MIRLFIVVETNIDILFRYQYVKFSVQFLLMCLIYFSILLIKDLGLKYETATYHWIRFAL